MDIVSFMSQLGSLSKVKQSILRELWGPNDSKFPKPWILSSRLLELTGQKYFDRRIRELRDELGCDIETGNLGSEHRYRLISSSLKKANPRYYLTESEKRDLFLKHDYTCQICGRKCAAGIRGIQADHKIPLVRGGMHTSTNWQPICNECNVGKRGACAECQDDCKQCPWAFPEVVGRVTLVRLPPKVLSALYMRCSQNQRKVESGIVEALSRWLNL
jgi:hypothetical protein